MLQRVKGWPKVAGRVVADETMSSRSVVVIRRGRPPAHAGSNEAIPNSLNRWIISRTRSGEVWTIRAITATSLPPAAASTTRARRHFTTELSLLPLPRRTIRCSSRPSASVSLRTRTGLDMSKVCATPGHKWWTRGIVVRALADQRCLAAPREEKERRHDNPDAHAIRRERARPASSCDGSEREPDAPPDAGPRLSRSDRPSFVCAGPRCSIRVPTLDFHHHTDRRVTVWVRSPLVAHRESVTVEEVLVRRVSITRPSSDTCWYQSSPRIVNATLGFRRRWSSRRAVSDMDRSTRPPERYSYQHATVTGAWSGRTVAMTQGRAAWSHASSSTGIGAAGTSHEVSSGALATAGRRRDSHKDRRGSS